MSEASHKPIGFSNQSMAFEWSMLVKKLCYHFALSANCSHRSLLAYPPIPIHRRSARTIDESSAAEDGQRTHPPPCSAGTGWFRGSGICHPVFNGLHCLTCQSPPRDWNPTVFFLCFFVRWLFHFCFPKFDGCFPHLEQTKPRLLRNHGDVKFASELWQAGVPDFTESIVKASPRSPC